MKSLFGVLYRCAPLQSIQEMLHNMANCSKNGSVIWHDEFCGLGQFADNAIADKNSMIASVMANGSAFACVARLDNRADIARALGLSSSEVAHASDRDLIRKAYETWGERCSERLFGDWSFVAWHPSERRLFLARDHFGITSLYYYVDEKVFAFASSCRVLLDLKFLPTKLDELYLAQAMTAWTAYHGERTIYTTIHRLPPAHRLTVNADHLTIQQYWYLEKTPELYLSRREDYVAAFRELFDEAVKARLRATDDPSGMITPIASTLSGGLDSSSVTAVAAGLLLREGRRLSAYTAVPHFDTSCYMNKGRFADEFPLAQSTALAAGNVDLFAIDAMGLSPIQAIKNLLQIHNEPTHAASNAFWMLELYKKALDDGNKIILLGQFGNPGLSWTGDVFSQSLLFQFRQVGFKKWARELVKRNLPHYVLALLRAYRQTNPQQIYRSSAINPLFADRLNLLERRYNDVNEKLLQTAKTSRYYVLKPGRSIVGALHAQVGATFGIAMRDPTADPRLLAFTFSVPDHIFIDPATGMNRWLIREAMKGRLPDDVRLNREMGSQAGDLVPRLRASAGEVDDVLAELARGPAAEYVDVPYMRQVWQAVQVEDTPDSYRKSVTILTRGIMAGLFVNTFYA